MVTRADVEKALWMQSAWEIEQEDVDRIMDVVDAYAQNGSLPPPAVIELPPATVLDLPLGERKRLLDRENRVAAEEFERGRLAGLLQAEEERSQESSVRPAGDLNPFPGPMDGHKAFREACDTLWHALRLPQEMLLDAIPAQRQSSEEARPCTRCGLRKPLSGFTKDPRGKNGLRGQCKDCEAELRAAKKQRARGEEAA